MKEHWSEDERKYLINEITKFAKDLQNRVQQVGGRGGAAKEENQERPSLSLMHGSPAHYTLKANYQLGQNLNMFL